MSESSVCANPDCGHNELSHFPGSHCSQVHCPCRAFVADGARHFCVAGCSHPSHICCGTCGRHTGPDYGDPHECPPGFLDAPTAPVSADNSRSGDADLADTDPMVGCQRPGCGHDSAAHFLAAALKGSYTCAYCSCQAFVTEASLVTAVAAGAGGHERQSALPPAVIREVNRQAELAAVIARVTDCMDCEGTGQEVKRWDADMNPVEFGTCHRCGKVADAIENAGWRKP